MYLKFKLNIIQSRGKRSGLNPALKDFQSIKIMIVENVHTSLYKEQSLHELKKHYRQIKKQNYSKQWTCIRRFYTVIQYLHDKSHLLKTNSFHCYNKTMERLPSTACLSNTSMLVK